MNRPQVIIIGAGAAGLFCAGLLSKQKISCLVIEKNHTPGKKIIISGGGRCNFTNLEVLKHHFVGESKNYHWNILKRYTNFDFIKLVKNSGISFYEKKLGQLFCKDSSKEILNFLLQEIDPNYALIKYSKNVEDISYIDQHFLIKGRDFSYSSSLCVVASGGLPMPAIGGSDLGIRSAKKFKIKTKHPQEALVPIKDSLYQILSGISLPVNIKINKKYAIKDDLLFTHKGLSGPAILKATLYKDLKDQIVIDFLPEQNIEEILRSYPKKKLLNTLSNLFPNRFADFMSKELGLRNINNNELSRKEINTLSIFIHQYSINYISNEGYRKAEVMKGGVLTSELDRGLESRATPGMYFIGETVDVTGLLGGYNFQWAWSSAYCCHLSILDKIQSSSN
jgi:predicted Rossmann fold flavoprotein